MPTSVRRAAVAATLVLGLTACDRVFTASPAERVGYLRELIRARTLSRDSVPIDACSVDHFMDGIPAWRDSLMPGERVHVGEPSEKCIVPREKVDPIQGRFVLTGWYRNWSGEYVIRGATPTIEQGYRFTDGVFVGRETVQNAEYVAGIAEPRGVPPRDTPGAASGSPDSIRRAGALADTLTDSASVGARPRDSARP